MICPRNGRSDALLANEAKEPLHQKGLALGAHGFAAGFGGKEERIEQGIFSGAPPIGSAFGMMTSVSDRARNRARARMHSRVFPHGT
jgi:hypothetical protein